MTLASGSGSSPVEQHLDEAVRRLGDEITPLDLSASDEPMFERPAIDFLVGAASYLEQPEFSEDDSDPESLSEGQLLERTLREHARRDKDGRKFWPYALLARLMTREQLRSVLLAEVEGNVDTILKGLGLLYDSAGYAPSLHDPLQTREAEAADRRDGYLRVFAILALLGRLDSLPRFLEAKLNDADLLNLRVDERLNRYKLRLRSGSRGSNPVSMVFRDWRTVELEMFVQHKESVSPPIFQSTKSGSRPYTILSDESTLPWTTADERRTSYGGVGSVHQVTLDPLSYYFEGYGDTDPTFALKRIQDLRTHRKMWEAEIYTLARFPPGSQDHIIPLLAAFKQKDDGFLLFPLADCNLREYWQLGPLAQHDITQLRWFSAQILGLAQALRFAHRINVRHGDIKPENILRIPGPETGLGRLVIADFGIARHHREVTELRGVTTEKDAFTANYRPPEFDMAYKVRSRKGDIWSLGCVLLESACWMLQGPKGVVEFERRRYSSREREGAFWEVETKGETEYLQTFRVKEEVRQTMEDLHRHPHCTAYVHALLDIVEFRMLVFQRILLPFENSAEERMSSRDPVIQLEPVAAMSTDENSAEERISSEDLAIQLEAMAAMSTDEYLTRHVPWDRQSIIQSSARAVEDPKPRETVEKIVRQIGNQSTLAAAFNISSIRLARHDRRDSQPSINRETPQISVVVPELPALTTERLPPVTDPAGDWSSAKDIEKALQVLLSPTTEHDHSPRKVEFYLHWELRRCIRDNLSGKSLGPVLTISGDETHSWAASCEEYVSHVWGETGKKLLKGLSSALEGESPGHHHDSSLGAVTYELAPAESEASSPSVVTIVAVPRNLVVMAQFLVWIAVTFRLPPESRECVASVASFTATSSSSFAIELGNLWELDARKPGTCWTALFPRTVIAYGFPVPRTWELFGLRIPLGTMIDLAGIVQDVTLQGDDGSDKGTYLDGMGYLIYPTRHMQAANEVQWHLVKKTSENRASVTFTPYLNQGLPWITDVDPTTLGSATAILGYCEKVRITLGTEFRMEQYKQYISSGTGVESPPAEAVLTNINVGVTAGGGPVRGNAAITAGLVYAKGLVEKIQENEQIVFTDMLNQTAKQPVILFETDPGEERAWMVPKLAVILDIYNFWAFRQGGSARKAMRFADAGFDAGENAKKVLEDERYVNLVVQKKLHKDDKNTTVGDVIRKIFRGLCKLELKNAEANDSSQPIKVRLGRQPVPGWDLLDLVDGGIVSYRRNVVSNTGTSWPLSEKPSWLPLTKSAPLLAMQGLGQVIIPDHEGQVCRNWDPVPGGYKNSYLVAMVNCLEFLCVSKNRALDRSSDSNNRWVFWVHGKKRIGWHVEGEALFRDCGDTCKGNPQCCWKQPQKLCEVKELNIIKALIRKPFSRGTGSSAPPPRPVPSTGAVVFAKTRKKPSPIIAAPTTASGTKLAPRASLLSLTFEYLPQILWTLAVSIAAAFLGKVFL